MKNSRNLRLATMLTTALAWSGINGFAGAEESATVPTDPGFKAGTGQLNPGVTHQAPSQSDEIISIPTPEESRRALLEPISKQPSSGSTPSVPRSETQTFGGPNTKQESQNAIGGTPGLTTGGSAPNSSASKAGGQAASTSTSFHCLPPASRRRPDRSVRLARRSPPNSPSETTSSIARPSWGGHCRSAISSACRYSMR